MTYFDNWRRSGYGAWTAAAYTGVVLIPVVLGRRAERRRAADREQSYVVPGGLIDGRGGRLFLRDHGIMIWHAEEGHLIATDAESGGVFARSVTASEGLLAMRAWISPLPPPSEEMVRQFLAGRQ